MSTVRRIKKIYKSRPTIEGAGVHLKRALGFAEAPVLDPFLLLDDFHSNNPADYIQGFPWHPHRGIETITYMLHGEIEHGDSMDNKGIIRSGDVQWMTAGSGIIHQEMPRGQKDGLMWGFQLWANLPASHKMMDPRYREIKKSQIPEVFTESGAAVKIICGKVKDVKGPVQDIITEPEYLDVTVPPKSSFRHRIPVGNTVFAYLIAGEGNFDDLGDLPDSKIVNNSYFSFSKEKNVGPEHLVTFEQGDKILVTTEDNAVRFLLISGKPIGEPVAWYGPIVMNTDEELSIAFEEYRNGSFIKYKK